MRWIPDSTLDHLLSPESAPEVPSGRYEIDRVIGKGGMGTVYLATDAQLDRSVALKVVEASDDAAELAARLVQEARILARLEHPGIVPIHDAGELPDGRLFYAMKYVDGERLDRYVEGARSLTERLRIFGRICEAVAFAHSRGVLHRDLKPQNIMVGAFGEVLVMDWGVAKVLSGRPRADAETVLQSAAARAPGVGAPGATEHGAVLGTPGYMAPEQARGEIGRLDARADVYSLGAVLRYLLTGGPAGGELETAVFSPADSESFATSSAALPRRLRAIIDKAMSSDVEGRYPTAAELAEDVDRFLDGQTVSALPEGLWTRSRRFVSKHRVAFVLILAYVVVRALVVLLPGSGAGFSLW